jgi:hypothetical protein
VPPDCPVHQRSNDSFAQRSTAKAEETELQCANSARQSRAVVEAHRAVNSTCCESSRPLSDVLVINDNCLWTNGSWRNKNAGLDHIG